MKTIKNVADFKRAVILGDKIRVIFHQGSAGRDEAGKIILKDEDRGERAISIVQSNKFALKTTKSNGMEVDSWMNIPKAAELKADGTNKVLIMGEDFRERDKLAQIPLMTCIFI